MATEQDLQALSPSDRARLERLAGLGGRTPLEMLYYVQRDGFEECEACVQASLLAEQEFAEGRTVPNKEMMEEARRRVDSYAKHSSNAK